VRPSHTQGGCQHRKETSGALSTSKAARERNIPVHSVPPSGFSPVIGQLRARAEVYGIILLLAKENLKVKSYLIENPVAMTTSVTPRGTLSEHSLIPVMSRIHDSRSPFKAELLRGHGVVCCEGSELKDNLDNVRESVRFLLLHDRGNRPAPMNAREGYSQPSRRNT
jgi:hypothetical protein